MIKQLMIIGIILYCCCLNSNAAQTNDSTRLATGALIVILTDNTKMLGEVQIRKDAVEMEKKIGKENSTITFTKVPVGNWEINVSLLNENDNKKYFAKSEILVNGGGIAALKIYFDETNKQLRISNIPVPQVDKNWIYFRYEMGLYTINEDGTRRDLVMQGRYYGANNNRGGRYLVFSGGDNNDCTYVANLDGKEMHQLPIPSLMHPRWSWKGTHLAGTLLDNKLAPQGPKIAIFDPDGSNLKILADGHHPVWTPDDRIVFANEDKIQVVNMDGTGLKKIIDKLDSPDTSDCSNKNQILFNARTTPYSAAGGCFDMEIYQINVDGTGLVQLTDSELVREVSAHFNYNFTKIVFERYIQSTSGDIWVMNADGSNQKEVISTTNNCKEATFYIF